MSKGEARREAAFGVRLRRERRAEDVAARVSVEAGEAIYHGLVHSMQDAAARWRASEARGERREARGDEDERTD